MTPAIYYCCYPHQPQCTSSSILQPDMPVAKLTCVHDKHSLTLLSLPVACKVCLSVTQDMCRYTNTHSRSVTLSHRVKASASVASQGFNDVTGPWAQKVFSPFKRIIGPFWKKMERKVQSRIDSLPPGVAAFLDVKTSESFSWPDCDLQSDGAAVHGPFTFTCLTTS